MFEKTQKAATQLSAAVTEETNEAINTVKAMVGPAIAGLFGSISAAAEKAKTSVESGEFLSKAKEKVAAAAEKVNPAADPLPTEDQNTAINVLRAAGKSDEAIAETLGVSVLTVKMAWEKQA